jgi:hypothetical protein
MSVNLSLKHIKPLVQRVNSLFKNRHATDGVIVSLVASLNHLFEGRNLFSRIRPLLHQRAFHVGFQFVHAPFQLAHGTPDHEPHHASNEARARESTATDC